MQINAGDLVTLLTLLLFGILGNPANADPSIQVEISQRGRAEQPIRIDRVVTPAPKVPATEAGKSTKAAYDGIEGLKYSSKQIQGLKKRLVFDKKNYVLRTHYYGYLDKLPKAFLRARKSDDEKKKAIERYTWERKTPFRYEVSVQTVKKDEKSIHMTPYYQAPCDIYIIDRKKKSILAHNQTQGLEELCVVCGKDGFVGEVPNGTHDVVVVCPLSEDVLLGEVFQQTFDGVKRHK